MNACVHAPSLDVKRMKMKTRLTREDSPRVADDTYMQGNIWHTCVSQDSDAKLSALPPLSRETGSLAKVTSPSATRRTAASYTLNVH